MSIKDEFRKMDRATTNPMDSINEVFVTQQGRKVWVDSDDDEKTIDAEVLTPENKQEPAAGIHVPQSITQPKPSTKSPVDNAILAAFGGASRDAQDAAMTKLVSIYTKHDPNALKAILKQYNVVVEGVMMPPEAIAPPAPQEVPTVDPTMMPEEVPQEEPKPFRDRLEDMKNEIEAKKGTGSPEEEKAWDDITSAFDLIAHHLDDINEDESVPEGEIPSEIPERHPAI